MINVAIIEDDSAATDLLLEYFKRFQENVEEEFAFFTFSKAILFLTNYTAKYDLIFMDIDLPDINGMVAARKLRELDRNVTLIFVTNMARFAVKGYEVEAYDFIVKPVSYANFVLKLKRALNYLKSKAKTSVLIPVDDGKICLTTDEIKFVEFKDRKIVYHTTRGIFYARGALTAVEKNLNDPHFIRCNSCYLVNLRFVTAVSGFSLFVDEEELLISHPRKAAVIRAINNYFGGSL